MSKSIATTREAHEADGARLGAVVAPAVRLVLAALAVALVVRTLVVEPFAIPSASMSPGLEAGDFIFVNKMAYGWGRSALPIAQPAGEADFRVAARPVAAGDVIVFAGPAGLDYVKRVIARGGDRIALERGRLILNGEPVPCIERAGDLCRERLPNGASHVVRETGVGELATFAELTVPQGHYFVLGDNRDASADSRLSPSAGGVGLVAEGQVLGRAQHIFFSARDRVRWGRIGQRID